MYSSKHPPINLEVLILYFLLILPWVNTLHINNHKLVYSKCTTNQTSTSPSHSALLSALFQELIARSSRSMFSESIVADFNNNIAISGNYQCRNDLSPDECTNCIRKIPALSENVCGEKTPARIQLSGCYVQCHEENGNDDEISSRPGDILSRLCSERKIRSNGFEEMKYAAFVALGSGVASGNGFCDAIYQGMHVVAQCAGYLGACDCGECVSNAVQVFGEEGCRFSVSGEIYLDSCSISYDYLDEGNGTEGRSSKLVAIVLGGLVLLLVGLAFCCFIRSCGKKEEG